MVGCTNSFTDEGGVIVSDLVSDGQPESVFFSGCWLYMIDDFVSVRLRFREAPMALGCPACMLFIVCIKRLARIAENTDI